MHRLGTLVVPHRPAPALATVGARGERRTAARHSLLAASLVGVIAAGIGATSSGAAADTAPAQPTTTDGATPTEQVLLPPPDPAGPTARGTFISDPQGQIERIAATGHLVAWSVRSPSDQADGIDAKRGGYRPRPIVPAAESHVVVVDERGGLPLTIPLGARFVRVLRMLRGVGGPAEPQLAIVSCTTRATKDCVSDLYTLTLDAPLATTAHVTGDAAALAAGGTVDSGRRLMIGPSKKKRVRGHRKPVAPCLPPMNVVTLATGAVQHLSALPQRDPEYTRCDGPVGLLLVGKYAFVTVSREDRADDLLAWFTYGIDTTAGPRATWAEIQRPLTASAGSTGDEIGPGITDNGLYWETNDDDDGYRYSLERAQLPGSFARWHKGEPRPASTSDPVAPMTDNACDVAATDDAIYELANVRCAEDPWGQPRDAGFGAGAIRRVVNPAWHAPRD